MALPFLVLILAVLLMTKSRSASLGLVVAMAVFLVRERASRRFMLRGGAVLVLGLLGLAGAAFLARQLDWKVVSEAPKSLTYRLEYWRGTWGVLTESPRAFWRGLGPGNFAGPYLRHKLPQSSEEIADPHDLVLEVWAIAGLPAAVALVAALLWGLRETLGRPKPVPNQAGYEGDPPPPRSGTWLVLASGLGGWLGVVVLGRLNPFDQEGMERWLVLGGAWLISAFLGRLAWRSRPIGGDLFGLGALAVAVNLLAAGGIAFAPVSEMLWALLAIGMNLREDRPCGSLREIEGRAIAFVPSAVLAAILGTFFGTVSPFWAADEPIARAEALVRSRPNRLDVADDLYARANELDVLARRGWIGRANLELMSWRSMGRPPELRSWSRIDSALETAAKRPRDPNSLLVQRLRARFAKEFLEASEFPPQVKTIIRKDRLQACAGRPRSIRPTPCSGPTWPRRSPISTTSTGPSSRRRRPWTSTDGPLTRTGNSRPGSASGWMPSSKTWSSRNPSLGAPKS